MATARGLQLPDEGLLRIHETREGLHGEEAEPRSARLPEELDSGRRRLHPAGSQQRRIAINEVFTGTPGQLWPGVFVCQRTTTPTVNLSSGRSTNSMAAGICNFKLIIPCLIVVPASIVLAFAR